MFGEVVAQRSAAALVAFMEKLAARYPDKTVYVVWDLNIHDDGADARWSQFNLRHGRRFRFVYTPKHASWMNQVEIWFSILQRRIIKYGDFDYASEIGHDVGSHRPVWLAMSRRHRFAACSTTW